MKRDSDKAPSIFELPEDALPGETMLDYNLRKERERRHGMLRKVPKDEVQKGLPNG